MSSSSIEQAIQFSDRLSDFAPSTPDSRFPMLKFIYSEADLQLELVNANLEDWVAQRVKLGNSYEHLCAIAARVCFPLPNLLCDLTILDAYLMSERVETVTIELCDAEHVEIGVSGYWVSPNADTLEGVFVAELPDCIEAYLCRLYSATQDRSIVGTETIVNG